MNAVPGSGDIEGAGTASTRRDSGSTVEKSLESQAFLEIVRLYAGTAGGTTGASGSGLNATDPPVIGTAQQLRSPRKKLHRPAEVADTPLATTGVAGGSPFSPVKDAAQRLTSVGEHSGSTDPEKIGEPRPAGRTANDQVSGHPAEHARSSSAQAAPAAQPNASAAPATNHAAPTLSASAVSPPGNAAPGQRTEPNVGAARSAQLMSVNSAVRSGPAAASSVARSAAGPTNALRAFGSPFGVQTRPGTPTKAPSEARPRAMVVESPEAQVARGLAQVLRQKGGSVTLRLTPDALGEVRVHLQIEGSDVRASMHTSSDAARETLARATESLRHSLESHGLNVTELRVVGPEHSNPGENTPYYNEHGGAALGDAPARRDGANERRELPDGAAPPGAPYAEQECAELLATDAGWSPVGGRLMIDTLA